MRLANQHKAYVGVLAVALGALGVDSFLLQGGSSGPAKASAAAAPPATPTAAASAATPAPSSAPLTAAPVAKAAEPTVQTPRLATRLESLKEASGPVEAGLLFAGAAEWLNPPPEKPAVEAEPVGGAASLPAPLPGPAHELSSVLVAGDRSCVILDGKTLRIGEHHADLVLVSVEHGAATFDHNGQAVRMEVPKK